MQSLSLPFSASPFLTSVFWIVFALWVVPELLAWKFKQSNCPGKTRDRGSLILIAILWWGAIGMDIAFSLLLPRARLASMLPLPFAIGISTMLLGIALRWYSAGILGKYFTFDVTIQAGQTVIERGPYRYLRHPSYTGALLTLLGFGLALGNWAGLAAAMGSMGLAYSYRIPVEERALTTALGDTYKQYMKRTWRLVPFLF